MKQQSSSNAETAVGNLMMNQLLIGNSKNIFLIVLSSLLSVYVTRYTTRKINSFRKLLRENPLFLLWGVLNVMTGKPFMSARKSINQQVDSAAVNMKKQQDKIPITM